MSDTIWTKVDSKRAMLVASHVDLSDEARELLDEEATSEHYYATLRERGLWIDAIRFLAAALPVWGAAHWAATCVREDLGDDADEGDLESLRLAEEWLRAPDEDTRHAAFAAAEKKGFDSPAAWTAVAAFWCGHSLSPPEAPAVPPPPGCAGKAASGALLLLAAAEPKKIEKSYATYLDLGEKLARGELELPEITRPEPARGNAIDPSTKEEG